MGAKPFTPIHDTTIYEVPVDALVPYPGNPRVGDVGAIAESLEANGQYRPIVVRRETREVLAGNHTLEAAKHLKWKTIKVTYVEGLTDQAAARIVLADNRLPDLGRYNVPDLTSLLEVVGGDYAGTGYDEYSITGLLSSLASIETTPLSTDTTNQPDASADRPTAQAEPTAETITLASRYLVPPFSVLDQRAGYWQERKRAWLSLGIESEEGRGENLLGMSETILSSSGKGAGTSIFDPVLCELAYRWFAAPGAQVLDPFAGGSVRGIVAAALGRHYTGLELRGEQVQANRRQAEEILPALGQRAEIDGPTATARWIAGDSNKTLDELPAGFKADLLFSCPPYADLEIYSDDPADISTMPYEEFVTIYRSIIRKAVERLNNDRFAVWVIGEVRDKHGRYRGFVPDTIRAFEDAGAYFYNEAILVSPVGTAAIRVGRMFEAGRKLGKVHQNVLVFIKGDPKKATAWSGPIEIADLRGANA